MKTLLKNFALVTAVAGLAAGTAYSVPVLTITDIESGVPTKIVVVQDNGALDTSLEAGLITYSGPVGAFNITVDTGVTKPAIGSVTSPDMDLTFTVVSKGAGMLVLTLTDSGFIYTGSLWDRIGGTTAGTVSDNVLMGGGFGVNGLLTGATNVASIAGLGSGAYSGQTWANVILGSHAVGDYLSIQAVITQTGAGSSSGDMEVSVPDGGTTAMLLGLGLLGVGFVARRFKSVKA
jgi:hypothetical protein